MTLDELIAALEAIRAQLESGAIAVEAEPGRPFPAPPTWFIDRRNGRVLVLRPPRTVPSFPSDTRPDRLRKGY